MHVKYDTWKQISKNVIKHAPYEMFITKYKSLMQRDPNAAEFISQRAAAISQLLQDQKNKMQFINDFIFQNFMVEQDLTVRCFTVLHAEVMDPDVVYDLYIEGMTAGKTFCILNAIEPGLYYH